MVCSKHQNTLEDTRNVVNVLNVVSAGGYGPTGPNLLNVNVNTKSREKLQELFRSVCVLFVNINIAIYFNLFLCPFKQRDMSVMTRVPSFIL